MKINNKIVMDFYQLITIIGFSIIASQVCAIPILQVSTGFDGGKQANEIIFTIPKGATGNNKQPTSNFKMNLRIKTKSILSNFSFDDGCDVTGPSLEGGINDYTFFCNVESVSKPVNIVRHIFFNTNYHDEANFFKNKNDDSALISYNKWLDIDGKRVTAPVVSFDISDASRVHRITYTMVKDQPFDSGSYESYIITSEIITAHKITFLDIDPDCSAKPSRSLDFFGVNDENYKISCTFYSRDGYTRDVTKVVTFTTNYSKDSRFLKDKDTYSIHHFTRMIESTSEISKNALQLKLTADFLYNRVARDNTIKFTIRKNQPGDGLHNVGNFIGISKIMTKSYLAFSPSKSCTVTSNEVGENHLYIVKCNLYRDQYTKSISKSIKFKTESGEDFFANNHNILKQYVTEFVPKHGYSVPIQIIPAKYPAEDLSRGRDNINEDTRIEANMELLHDKQLNNYTIKYIIPKRQFADTPSNTGIFELTSRIISSIGIESIDVGSSCGYNTLEESISYRYEIKCVLKRETYADDVEAKVKFELLDKNNNNNMQVINSIKDISGHEGNRVPVSITPIIYSIKGGGIIRQVDGGSTSSSSSRDDAHD